MHYSRSASHAGEQSNQSNNLETFIKVKSCQSQSIGSSLMTACSKAHFPTDLIPSQPKRRTFSIKFPKTYSQLSKASSKTVLNPVVRAKTFIEVSANQK
jgi:hypothetical protein